MDIFARVVPSDLKKRFRLLEAEIKRRAERTYGQLWRPWMYFFHRDPVGGICAQADTHLEPAERLLLYALIRAIRPRRVLEIGSFRGGSAAIICAAMEENGFGTMVGVDPVNAISTPEAAFFGRFQLVEAASPDGLALARSRVDAPFDFVHLDGINIYDQLRADFEGALSVMASSGHVLVNNPFHCGVSMAVEDVLEGASDLHDAGYLARWVDVAADVHCTYAGLRLIRRGTLRDQPEPVLSAEYAAAGRQVPAYTEALKNHDHWYCGNVRPCPVCQSAEGARSHA